MPLSCSELTKNYGRFASSFSKQEEEFLNKKSYAIRIFVLQMAKQYPDAYSNNSSQQAISVKLDNQFPILNTEGFFTIRDCVLKNISNSAKHLKEQSLVQKSNSIK